MKLFRDKKQVERVKSVPVNHSVKVSKELTLAGLRVVYSKTQREPFFADLTYKEFPEQWSDENNQQKTIHLTANTWPELIDKVVVHFEEQS